jgi:hypothetical protein
VAAVAVAAATTPGGLSNQMGRAQASEGQAQPAQPARSQSLRPNGRRSPHQLHLGLGFCLSLQCRRLIFPLPFRIVALRRQKHSRSRPPAKQTSTDARPP